MQLLKKTGYTCGMNSIPAVATDIASASASDLEDVVGLLDAAQLPHQDVTAELLAHFLLVRGRGALIGVIGLEPLGRVGLLRSLAVASQERGRGLGIALTHALERRARGLGIEDLYLLTTTADRFFAKLGYRRVPRADAPPEIQRTTEFRELCADSSILMVRRLA
jgi:amino-acid N-acetyltransferase